MKKRRPDDLEMQRSKRSRDGGVTALVVGLRCKRKKKKRFGHFGSWGLVLILSRIQMEVAFFNWQVAGKIE